MDRGRDEGCRNDTIYRDPNAAVPCGDTASTVNLTNTGSIGWSL